MSPLASFYKNRKVLVTGHTGFKGSWLTIWLKELGAEVSGISLDPRTDKDLFVLAGLTEKVRDYRQDIRDFDKLTSVLENEQPEIVFHLAAQALVIPGYRDPIGTFSINSMGTANILEACRHTASVRHIVIVTTDKVYENGERLAGYKECDPLGGYDPYSASKAAAEIITQSYRQSFFQTASQSACRSIATARAGNVIGGGDWSEFRLVPDCIKALEENRPVTIRNPESVRPWQHVLEPLSGYLLLASKMAEDPARYSEAWNFGPGEKDLARVKDLADQLLKCWGAGKWIIDKENSNFHETAMLRLNIDKAKEILGWQPVLSFIEAVQWTGEWYKAYKSCDAYRLCADQINEYSDK